MPFSSILQSTMGTAFKGSVMKSVFLLVLGCFAASCERKSAQRLKTNGGEENQGELTARENRSITALPTSKSDRANANGVPGLEAFRNYNALKDDARESAHKYLLEAAIKGYPRACKKLAYLGFSEDIPFSQFGETEEIARINLLERAPADDMDALGQLARAYRDASPPVQNLVRARSLLKVVSEAKGKDYWFDYSRMCERGEGGEVDLLEAYIYTSANARSTHPESLGGASYWKKRRELAEQLTKPQLEYALKTIDEKYLHVAEGAFLRRAVPDEVVEEGRRIADEMEAGHRKSIEKRD